MNITFVCTSNCFLDTSPLTVHEHMGSHTGAHAGTQASELHSHLAEVVLCTFDRQGDGGSTCKSFLSLNERVDGIDRRYRTQTLAATKLARG